MLAAAPWRPERDRFARAVSLRAGGEVRQQVPVLLAMLLTQRRPAGTALSFPRLRRRTEASCTVIPGAQSTSPASPARSCTPETCLVGRGHCPLAGVVPSVVSRRPRLSWTDFPFSALCGRPGRLLWTLVTPELFVSGRTVPVSRFQTVGR